MSSRPVRARLDPSSRAALAVLMAEGRNESEAVRAALVESAARRRRRSALRAEARRASADPEDRAAIAEVMEDMASLEPEWPAG